jgi:hypothetical protein
MIYGVKLGTHWREKGLSRLKGRYGNGGIKTRILWMRRNLLSLSDEIILKHETVMGIELGEACC